MIFMFIFRWKWHDEFPKRNERLWWYEQRWPPTILEGYYESIKSIHEGKVWRFAERNKNFEIKSGWNQQENRCYYLNIRFHNKRNVLREKQVHLEQGNGSVH